MKFDLTKPCQTRDGRKARIICTNRVNDDCSPVLALVTEEGVEDVISYHSDGAYFVGEENPVDLINIPQNSSCVDISKTHRGMGCDKCNDEGLVLHIIDNTQTFWPCDACYTPVNKTIKKKKTCKHAVKLKHSCEQCGRVKHPKGKKTVGWGNVYLVGNMYNFGKDVFSSRESAFFNKDDLGYIDTIKISVGRDKLEAIG